ncbi:unnamed protein product, partial [Scytosiphon promiscuus]
NPAAAGSGGGGQAGAEAESTIGDNMATAAATGPDAAQYAMSPTERMKAYRGIFRTGGEKLKKRPRSPVKSTPLYLPFPTPPGRGRGGSLRTADLEERPPCGAEEHVQTEAGSEWAWGLLTADRTDIGDGGAGGDGDGSGGSGGGGGAGKGREDATG